jgi:SAM-dependent methyltransferase
MLKRKVRQLIHPALLPCSSFDDVYQLYVDRMRELIGRYGACAVLKTDMHNESAIYADSLPIIRHYPGVEWTSVEMDKLVYKRAVKRIDGANLICDDLRTVYFPDHSFDIVADFSTLDHLEPTDASLMLYRYRKWLKPGGILYLCVWVTNGRQRRERSQWVFNRDFLNDAIWRSDFRVIRQEAIFGDYVDQLQEHECVPCW